MKKLGFISRFASLLAAVLVAGTGAALTSCDDDDTDKTAPVPQVKLATPQNPVAGAATGEELTFSWDAVGDAYSYSAQLRLNQAGAVIKETIVNGALNTVTFGNLMPDTEYYFQVRANHEYTQGKDSYFSEMIGSKTKTVDPQHTALARPENLMCDQSRTTANSLSFRWDVVENAVTYTYKIAVVDGQERLGVFTSAELTTEEGKLTATVSGLDEATSYTFQVRANPAEDSPLYRSGPWCDPIEAATMGKLTAPVATADETAITTSSLRFTWETVANAGSYSYAVSEDGGATYGEATATSNLYAVLGSLTDGTEYFFRVKALPVEGSVDYIESEYGTATATTISAAAERLATPTPVLTAGSETASGFTITWPPVTGVASYDVEIDGDADIKSTTDATYTASGLTPSTDYKIRVKAIAASGQTALLDSEWSAWVNVTTAAASDAKTISNVAEFDQALLDIADKGTIQFNTGTYVIDKAVSIGKTITLVPASGAEVTISGAQFELTAYAGLTLKNITFNGTKQDETLADILVSYDKADPVDKIYGDLMVDNCVITNYKKRLFSIEKGACYVNSVTYQNCIISNIMTDGADFFDVRTGITSKIDFSKNTVYNCAAERDLFRFDDGYSNAAVAAPSSVVINIANNTFHNIMTGAQKRLAYIRITGNDTRITNNIVSNDSANTSGYTNQSKTNITSFSGNNYNNASGYYENATSSWKNDTSTNYTTLDPQYTNAAEGDFTVGNATLKTNGTGAPRWLQ